MINNILKIIIFCFGILLSLDAVLPTRTYTLQVDHTAIHSNLGKKYRVYFNSNTLSACAVNQHGYDSLKNGDIVQVNTTRLINLCVKIERDNLKFYQSYFWRLLAFFGGIVFCTYAIGSIKPEANP